MCDVQSLLAFVLACVAIILAPGPSQALILARTIEGGRRAGMLTAIGINAATLVHAAAAGLGLSAVLAQSALVFDTVKFAGGAYLVFLGVRAIATSEQRTTGRAVSRAPPSHALGQAFLTGPLNPKVALFFLAFLPQFICPSKGSVLLQALVLGGVLGVMDTIYAALLISVASSATSWLSSPRATIWRSRVTGGVLLALGLRLAFAERR